MQSGPAATLLSIMVIASLALAGGGFYLALRRGDLKKGMLMLVAAVVLLGNVLIWTI